jgi:hypothetical protein
MPTSNKPLKIGEQKTWEVEGHTITLTRVEPTTHTFGPENAPVRTKEQKSRYEVVVGGEVIGFINCATGFEKRWYIQAIGDARETASHYEMLRPRNIFPTEHDSVAEREGWERDSLVLKVPEMIREGLLVPRKVLEDRARIKRRAEVKDEQDKAQRSLETKRDNWLTRKDKYVWRAERIKALETILARLRPQMTNAEIDHLVETIEALKDVHENENSLDFYWYDTEAHPDAVPNERAGLEKP